MPQGPLSPGTTADDATVGTEVWLNTGNVTASDDVYATVSLGGDQSHYLKATNFGFAIPVGVTIDGILVETEMKASLPGVIFPNSVKIVKAGAISGDEQVDLVGDILTTDTYLPWGDVSYLWGLSWTPADINATTFGVAVSLNGTGTGSIDHIRITVYFTGGLTLTQVMII